MHEHFRAVLRDLPRQTVFSMDLPSAMGSGEVEINMAVLSERTNTSLVAATVPVELADEMNDRDWAEDEEPAPGEMALVPIHPRGPATVFFKSLDPTPGSRHTMPTALSMSRPLGEQDVVVSMHKVVDQAPEEAIVESRPLAAVDAACDMLVSSGFAGVPEDLVRTAKIWSTTSHSFAFSCVEGAKARHAATSLCRHRAYQDSGNTFDTPTGIAGQACPYSRTWLAALT